MYTQTLIHFAFIQTNGSAYAGGLSNKKHKYTAAVSCSPVPYRLQLDRIGYFLDGQAVPCMGAMHGCMGEAWHFGLASIVWGA